MGIDHGHHNESHAVSENNHVVGDSRRLNSPSGFAEPSRADINGGVSPSRRISGEFNNSNKAVEGNNYRHSLRQSHRTISPGGPEDGGGGTNSTTTTIPLIPVKNKAGVGVSVG